MHATYHSIYRNVKTHRLTWHQPQAAAKHGLSEGGEIDLW